MSSGGRPAVGILALQGGFSEHAVAVRKCGCEAVEVRLPEQLDAGRLKALVMPGGESTAMAKIAARWGMTEPLRKWVQDGNPTFGTCAGMILLANELGGLDVEISRNHFGSQGMSFETSLMCKDVCDDPIRGVFIRAPAVTKLTSDKVSVVAALPDDGTIVAVRQGHVLGAAFHPELTHDKIWHWYFLTRIAGLDIEPLEEPGMARLHTDLPVFHH